MEIMCKIIGIVLVIGATGYFAKDTNDVMELRLKELTMLYDLLLQLKSELTYMSMTLPECFHSLSDSFGKPFDEWFNNMLHEMNNERTRSFTYIWNEQLKRLSDKSALTADDLNIMSELGDKLGNADVESSAKAIDYVLLRIEERRKHLSSELQQKKKMVVSLSLFVGLMTIILLF